jgi:hypothetical protein
MSNGLRPGRGGPIDNRANRIPVHGDEEVRTLRTYEGICGISGGLSRDAGSGVGSLQIMELPNRYGPEIESYNRKSEGEESDRVGSCSLPERFAFFTLVPILLGFFITLLLLILRERV